MSRLSQWWSDRRVRRRYARVEDNAAHLMDAEILDAYRGFGPSTDDPVYPIAARLRYGERSAVARTEPSRPEKVELEIDGEPVDARFEYSPIDGALLGAAIVDGGGGVVARTREGSGWSELYERGDRVAHRRGDLLYELGEPIGLVRRDGQYSRFGIHLVRRLPAASLFLFAIPRVLEIATRFDARPPGPG